MRRILVTTALSLLLSCVSAPLLMAKEARGFHYVPLPPVLDYYLSGKAFPELEFNTLWVNLGGNVYGGDGEESMMWGLGATGRMTWEHSPFISLTLQYGLNLLFGDPPDESGDERTRLSLQSPLGLYYAVQIYRDDRNTPWGQNFALYAGPLFPIILDVTTDGYATAGDFGGQIGVTYAASFRNSSVLQLNVALAKFLNGYYYINDLGKSDLQDISGEPVDLAAGVHWLYVPWQMGLGSDFHFTSSLADAQGDSLYMLALKFIYYPKPNAKKGS